MLKGRTAASKSTISKRQIRINNTNLKHNCLSSSNPSEARSGRASPYSLTFFNNTIDAVYLKAFISPVRSPRILSSRKQSTVPYSRSNFCQNNIQTSLLTISKLITRQPNQSVNSKTKNQLASPTKITTIMKNHIYYLTLLLLVLCALLTSVQADKSLIASVEKLKIPENVPITSSTPLIKVKLSGLLVKPGDVVPAKNFKDLQMSDINWDAAYDSRYTLILLDLDRKIQNATSFYNQFTSVNIMGSNLAGGQSIVALDPPIVPCSPTLRHRLVMLVFEQSQSIDLADIAQISASSGPSPKRENFDLDNFIKRFRLSIAGANVFNAAGETSSLCNGSATMHSIQSVTPILFAMVMALTILRQSLVF